MKKISCFLLAVLLLACSCTSAFAEAATAENSETAVTETQITEETAQQEVTETPAAEAVQTAEPVATAEPVTTTSVPNNIVQARTVIGADLTDDQINSIYNVFGITRGSVTELRVTNADERNYLEGYVDSSVIGTRSISSVYVQLKNDGSGMDVTTSNITWCTSDMYISALATAGITDAKIVVAAPFECSGTAALVGIYKAYEDITGQKLSDLAKAVSTQELTVTGSLAQEIGSMDSVSIVNDLKLMLNETANMTDEEIKSEVVEIAQQYNVSLTDAQISQLISLCRSLEGLDDNALLQRVKDIQGTLQKVSEAKTQVVGFVQTVKKVVTSISEFFDRIKDIIGL